MKTEMFCSAEGKRTWSHEEDQLLLGAIQRQGGPKNWGLIAEEHAAGLSALGLQPRSAKSCRLRWFNQLDPSLLRTPLTKKEEDLIDTLVTTMGTCWSAIAKQLPGRTDNIVKNYWYGKFGNRTRCRKRKSQGTEAHVSTGGDRLARRAERRGSRRAATADSGYSTLSDSDGSDEEVCMSGMLSDWAGMDVSDGEAGSPARRRQGRRSAAAHTRRASTGTRAASGAVAPQAEQEREAAGHHTVAAVPAECMATMPVILTLKRLNTGSNSRTGSQASAGAVVDDSAAALGAANSGACSPCSASAGRSSRMARGSNSAGLGASRAAHNRNTSFIPNGEMAAVAPAVAPGVGSMTPSATQRMSMGTPAGLPTAPVWPSQPSQASSDVVLQRGARNGMSSASAEQLQAGISRMQVHLQGTMLAGPPSFNGATQGPAAAAAALLQGAATGMGSNTAAAPFSSVHNWPNSCNSLASRASVGSYCAPPSMAQTPSGRHGLTAPTLSLLSVDDSAICSDYKSLSMMMLSDGAPALGWAASGSAFAGDPGSSISVQDTVHTLLPPTLGAPPMPRNATEAARVRHCSVHSSSSAWDPVSALMDLNEDAILADVPGDLFVAAPVHMDVLQCNTIQVQHAHVMHVHQHHMLRQQQYMCNAHNGMPQQGMAYGQHAVQQVMIGEQQPYAGLSTPWPQFNMGMGAAEFEHA